MSCGSRRTKQWIIDLREGRTPSPSQEVLWPNSNATNKPEGEGRSCALGEGGSPACKDSKELLQDMTYVG